MLPLLKEVAEWLNSHVSDAALQRLYEFIKENEEFKKVCKVALDYGIKKALSFLQRVKNHLVETCQENKELMKALTKTATKGTFRYFAFDLGAKAVVKYGVKKVGSQSIKRALSIANPAGVIFDLGQAGVEYAGYEKQGKAIGKWGNVGTGAVTGFVVGGPLGAAVGALTGFGTWVVGEAFGRAIDETIG